MPQKCIIRVVKCAYSLKKLCFLSEFGKYGGTLKGMFSDKLLPEHLYFVLVRFAMHPKSVTSMFLRTGMLDLLPETQGSNDPYSRDLSVTHNTTLYGNLHLPLC